MQLKVGIECRIHDFRQGAGTTILSLTRALCDLPHQGERYTFIVFEDHGPLFTDIPSDRATVLSCPRPTRSQMKDLLSRFAPLRDALRFSRACVAPIPPSDGTAERNRFDVVHFPTQVGYTTCIPSIYQPWDLQHVHLPQFFSRAERIWRKRVYKALCTQARFVSVQTQWGRDDLIRHYGVETHKVVVIPWGSPLIAYPRVEPRDLQATSRRYDLPTEFLFFPAVTWPHKNHEVVIRALSKLKQEGLRIPFVCTGATTTRLPCLEALADQCGVADLVRFLGFVSPVELQSIYSLATAMVFPSRFEGFGLPVLEAFQSGLPVVCSRATVLPEVAGDAAIFFDPDDPADLAEAIRAVTSSPTLRSQLVQRGRATAAERPMCATAEQFRRLYWRAAGSASPELQSTDAANVVGAGGRQ